MKMNITETVISKSFFTLTLCKARKYNLSTKTEIFKPTYFRGSVARPKHREK